jgi:alpha-1,2-mannosyltransferase
MPETTEAIEPIQRADSSAPRWLGAAAASLLLVGVIMVLWFSVFPPSGEIHTFVDLDYYRAALAVAASGQPLLAALPYPPFAIVPVTPLSWFSVTVGNAVWTAGSMLLFLVLAVLVAYRSITVRNEPVRPDALVTRTALAGILLLLSWPAASQLFVGQLSIVVMTLAVLDLADVLPKPLRGALVGLAGAIKITPLIFVPYYLVTGQRRQAAVATGSFLAFTGVGFLLFPSDSVAFWSHLGKSDGFGDPCRWDNLSIRSGLCRISPDLASASWLWLAIAALVALAALWHARRAFADGDSMRAALTVGAAATVMAPIAWPHYFVWLPLAAVWLIFSGRRASLLVGAGIFVVFSLIYMLWVFLLIGTEAPLTGPVINIAVLVPVLVGLFGLPGGRPRRGPDAAGA